MENSALRATTASRDKDASGPLTRAAVEYRPSDSVSHIPASQSARSGCISADQARPQVCDQPHSVTVVALSKQFH